MAGSYKNRTISTDFAVFLNTFLIISTVIVFAVLVFISYQNINNEYIGNSMSNSASLCADAASDYLLLSENADDADVEMLREAIDRVLPKVKTIRRPEQTDDHQA